MGAAAEVPPWPEVHWFFPTSVVYYDSTQWPLAIEQNKQKSKVHTMFLPLPELYVTIMFAAHASE